MMLQSLVHPAAWSHSRAAAVPWVTSSLGPAPPAATLWGIYSFKDFDGNRKKSLLSFLTASTLHPKQTPGPEVDVFVFHVLQPR